MDKKNGSRYVKKYVDSVSSNLKEDECLVHPKMVDVDFPYLEHEDIALIKGKYRCADCLTKRIFLNILIGK